MWFRNVLQLGLPLGNTLIVVGLMEFTILCSYLMLDVAQLLYYTFVEKAMISEVEIGIAVTASIFKVLGTMVLLWIGSIFVGSHRMIIAWIISILLFLIYVVVMVIITAVNSELRQHSYEAIYTIVSALLLYSYQIIIGLFVYFALKREEVLQPIGKGMIYIWEFFCNDLHHAAKFFIISEIALDVQYLFLKRFFLHFFQMEMLSDSAKHPMLLGEQVLMTLIRIVMDGIGLYLVNKDSRRLVRLWCIAVAIQILTSTAIFVMLTVTWRGVDIIDSVGVFLFFPIHLLYRCLVLYFCLRYTHVNFSTMVL